MESGYFLSRPSQVHLHSQLGKVTPPSPSMPWDDHRVWRPSASSTPQRGCTNSELSGTLFLSRALLNTRLASLSLSPSSNGRARMKLGTKVAGSKRSVGGQTAPDEGGLEFAPLAMPKDGGRESSLEQGLSAVVHMSTIVASEHD